MGAWFIGFQAPPFWALCQASSGQRGGLAAGLWGCAHLAAQCAGPSWHFSVCTRLMGPMPPRLGAFQCGGLRLAVALTLGPRKRVPHPKGTVIEIAPWPVGLFYLRFMVMVRRVGWSRAHGVECAILHSILVASGLQFVRIAYASGALDAWSVPSGPLDIHHGDFGHNRQITGTHRS